MIDFDDIGKKYSKPTLEFCVHLVKVGAFAWYSVKIRVILGVRFERRNVDIKSKSTWKLKHANPILVLRSVQLTVTEIDRYNFKPYRFKVDAFFRDTVYSAAWLT